MYNQEELHKLKHDLKRPFSNLQMLITILKGKDVDKKWLLDGLEKIHQDGIKALELLEESRGHEK